MDTVIFSHQRVASGAVGASAYRALSQAWVIRLVELKGVMDDERLGSPAVGRGIEEARARLTLVLAGRLCVWARDRAWELGAGEGALVVPLSLMSSAGGPCVVVELDWALDSQVPSASFLRLSPGLSGSAWEVARALGAAGSGEGAPPFARAAAGLTARLRAAGIDVPLHRGVEHDAAGQRVIDALDGALSRLDLHPQSVDLEARLGCSRWTLTRVLHQFHTTYGVCGIGGGTDWRSVRDFARLQGARILSTQEGASLGAVARSVGYRSTEAMCHAFANAGLPSPGQVRRSILASL
jgi:AraC-like DNA-binding protein